VKKDVWICLDFKNEVFGNSDEVVPPVWVGHRRAGVEVWSEKMKLMLHVTYTSFLYSLIWCSLRSLRLLHVYTRSDGCEVFMQGA
jgi:hypothetical protein